MLARNWVGSLLIRLVGYMNDFTKKTLVSSNGLHLFLRALVIGIGIGLGGFLTAAGVVFLSHRVEIVQDLLFDNPSGLSTFLILLAGFALIVSRRTHRF